MTETPAPSLWHSLQILICQNLRNNLQHPNEYIRGVTLRFLCRIKVRGSFGPHVWSAGRSRCSRAGTQIVWHNPSPPPLRITPQQEEEILEPLVPSILANLEHRHSYVRRNAVLAINQLYK